LASKSIAPAKAQKGKIAKPKEKALQNPPLQGDVVWVDVLRKVVWINLGQADGLKPRTRFQATEKQDDEVVKGQIEVIRNLAPHIAEARILSHDEKDPIAKGDLIRP
jgi:hypothetical protein